VPHVLHIFLLWLHKPSNQLSAQALINKKRKSGDGWNSLGQKFIKLVSIVVPCRWGETMSLNCGHKRAYSSSRRWYIRVWIATVEWYWQRANRRTRRETCPSATLSTTNPTRTDPDGNPDLCSDRSATNRLSYVMAHPHNSLFDL
jgi:hypothetical protein